MNEHIRVSFYYTPDTVQCTGEKRYGWPQDVHQAYLSATEEAEATAKHLRWKKWNITVRFGLEEKYCNYCKGEVVLVRLPLTRMKAGGEMSKPTLEANLNRAELEIDKLQTKLAHIQTLRKSEVERNIALAAENERMRAVIETLEREVDELEEINSRLRAALER